VNTKGRDHSNRPHVGGSVGSALRVRSVRLVIVAALGSGIGTWIQNLVLPVYVYDRTRSATAVAVIGFAQLGPYLFISLPAAALIDSLKRRSWLLSTQLLMLVGSVLLSLAVASEAALVWLFLAQLVVGIGNALDRPAWTAMLPSLVSADNLGGISALNGLVINSSRILGPLIVAVLAPLNLATWHFFLGNAITYLFVMAALVSVSLPEIELMAPSPWKNFASAVSIIAKSPELRRLVVSISAFSFVSLTYIGLFPAITSHIYSIEGRSITYKWLYAVWALGAGIGGLAIGTFLGGRDMRRAVQIGFLVTMIGLGGIGLSSAERAAFVFFFVVGFGYFLATTAMTAVLQTYLAPHERGRVLAIWFMCFGGVVPLGTLTFGAFVDSFGARWLVLLGATVSGVLAYWCDLVRVAQRAE